MQNYNRLYFIEVGVPQRHHKMTDVIHYPTDYDMVVGQLRVLESGERHIL